MRQTRTTNIILNSNNNIDKYFGVHSTFPVFLQLVMLAEIGLLAAESVLGLQLLASAYEVHFIV